MKRITAAALSALLLVCSAQAAEVSEATTILKAADVQGGLCLVLGAKDTSLAASLAKESSLYVQLLQPDPKTAGQWGAACAAGEQREQLGVREAAFDARQYDTNLFNLIVVEDPAALGKAKAADLFRVLVPEGVVVFRRAPDGFADAAAELKMQPVEVEKFAAAFRKPVVPVEWKPPLSLKWQAGERSQIARGFSGICATDGKLFYLERIELDKGNLNDSGAQLFARDAYNGRTVWTRLLPGGWVPHGYQEMVASRDGRLFVRAGWSTVLCLDARTGKTLSTVVSGLKGGRIRMRLFNNDELLQVGGSLYSTKDGKLVRRLPSYRYQPLHPTIIGENVYFCDGTTITAKHLATWKNVWTKPVSELPKKAGSNSVGAAGKYLIVRLGAPRDQYAVAALDPATGKLLWSYTWKITISKTERYFSAGKVRYTTVGDKLLLYYRHNQATSYADEVVVTRLDLATGKEEVKDKVLSKAGDFHGCFGELQLGNYIAWYDLWVDKTKLETLNIHTPHPACFFGSKAAYGLIYNFPSRKSGPITAVGPADTTVEKAPVANALISYGKAPAAEATKPGDWPMFRGEPSGGNFIDANLGTELVKAWETPVGLGKTSFGIMSSRPTGLTQAVVAYGLAVVGDIDGQRIVALNAADGEQKWVFHVGSRVDYPPTLTNGLCLFAARDGWVYCLNAKTGELVYKRLVAPRESYIGSREKIESRWPLTSDVLIVNGTAYVAGGGGLAFKPETGQVVKAKNPGGIATGAQSVPGGRDLILADQMVWKGNSIPRTNEDNKHGFRMQRFGRKLDARVFAFDNALTVAYHFYPAGEGWANKGTLRIKAIEKDPKKPVWQSPAIQLVVDDMVLTPDYVYAAGHYQRVKKDPELWIMSRKDGKVLKKFPAGGFPAFLGMSASGNKLYVSTREGKLICFEGK